VTDESLKNLKEKLAAVIESSEKNSTETTVSISAATALEIVKRLEDSEKKIEWLERKKRTIADLASAGHNWSQAKLDLTNKRLLHVAEVLDSGQGVYDGLPDDSQFNRGYRAALYWFRSEILDDELFADEKKNLINAKG
jgi:hypothetical protein